ncbi:hypothetical protein B9G98_03946 [Wickerhamiella sorbophila]|uniref:RING-type domain-containing protein n=1 Tax=Wickerhamiella sorbophila TaxID=45607 RepID=A0A2T0FMW3_9ASCO|nr:hypothetical protein B9G98_03946 [Wickerhamiella sorbophila]PRT56326.1 hypothetical protein B9G98_03946 [Wickerhamiella sorbophila]
MSGLYPTAHEKDSPRSHRLRRLFKSSTSDTPLTPTTPEGQRGSYFVNNSLEKLHGCEIVSPPDDLTSTPLNWKKETGRQQHHYQLEDFRSISSTSSYYSTQNLVRTNFRESYCAVCDFPLVYTLSNEHTIELDCGHRAHQECYSNMITQAVSELQCLHCENSRYKLNVTNERDDICYGVANQQPHTPPLRSTKTLEPAFSPSLNSSDLCSYYTSLYAPFQTRNHLALEASITPAYETISDETKKIVCLAKLKVPVHSDSDYDYRSSAADINYGRTFTEELSKVSFHGKLLASVPKGKLRLLDVLYVTYRNNMWVRCYAYLFSKLMIICRVDMQGNQTVQFILSVKDIEQVQLEDLEKGKALCLITLSKALPELFLSTEDEGVLYKWRLALYNPEYEFPLAPRPNGDRDFIQNYVLMREPQVPLDLVFCISLSDVADSVKTRRVVQAIQKLHSTMSSFDRLGIVFFGHSLLKSFPLSRKVCGNWDAITEELVSLTSSKIESSFDYTDLLACCESLLSSYCSTRSFASVIVVSDLKDASFSYVPWTFIKAGTPISTFDISTSNSNILSNISSKTGGRYVLLENVNGLIGPMEELLKFEKMHRLKNNVVSIHPSDDVQILSVISLACMKLGRATMKRVAEDDLSNDIDHSDSRRKTVQIELGNLKAGQAYTFFVELSLDSMKGAFNKALAVKTITKEEEVITTTNLNAGARTQSLHLFNMQWDTNETLSPEPISDYSVMKSSTVKITSSYEFAADINIEVLYYKVCLKIADLLSELSFSTPRDSRVGVFGSIESCLKDAEATISSSYASFKNGDNAYSDALASLIVATKGTISYYNERLASLDRLGQLASLVTDTTWCLRTRRSYTILTPLHVHFHEAKVR